MGLAAIGCFAFCLYRRCRASYAADASKKHQTNGLQSDELESAHSILRTGCQRPSATVQLTGVRMLPAPTDAFDDPSSEDAPSSSSDVPKPSTTKTDMDAATAVVADLAPKPSRPSASSKDDDDSADPAGQPVWNALLRSSVAETLSGERRSSITVRLAESRKEWRQAALLPLFARRFNREGTALAAPVPLPAPSRRALDAYRDKVSSRREEVRTRHQSMRETNMLELSHRQTAKRVLSWESSGRSSGSAERSARSPGLKQRSKSMAAPAAQPVEGRRSHRECHVPPSSIERSADGPHLDDIEITFMRDSHGDDADGLTGGAGAGGDGSVDEPSETERSAPVHRSWLMEHSVDRPPIERPAKLQRSNSKAECSSFKKSGFGSLKSLLTTERSQTRARQEREMTRAARGDMAARSATRPRSNLPIDPCTASTHARGDMAARGSRLHSTSPVVATVISTTCGSSTPTEAEVRQHI